MAIIGRLKRPYGTGYKVYTSTATTSGGTATVDTGFTSIESVSVTPTGTTAVIVTVEVSGGTITIHTFDTSGAATDATVYVIAIGY